MKVAIGQVVCVASVALSLASVLFAPAWPGGLGEDHTHDKPSYFGFVKDPKGKIIADARVKADIKGRFSLVARSDATGMYKIPELTKDISPKDFTISCSKEGYQQTRIFTRSRQNVKPVQVECTLQWARGKNKISPGLFFKEGKVGGFKTRPYQVHV